jgi:hypothetical protein
MTNDVFQEKINTICQGIFLLLNAIRFNGAGGNVILFTSVKKSTCTNMQRVDFHEILKSLKIFSVDILCQTSPKSYSKCESFDRISFTVVIFMKSLVNSMPVKTYVHILYTNRKNN